MIVGIGDTFTSHSALSSLPSTVVAEITVTPSPIVETRPLSETVATSSLLDDHETMVLVVPDGNT